VAIWPWRRARASASGAELFGLRLVSTTRHGGTAQIVEVHRGQSMAILSLLLGWVLLLRAWRARHLESSASFPGPSAPGTWHCTTERASYIRTSRQKSLALKRLHSHLGLPVGKLRRGRLFF
jgi:hypothetical protein